MIVSNIQSSPLLKVSNFNAKNSKSENVADSKVMHNVSNVLVDKNYGVLQTKKMNLSFKGTPALPAKTLSNKVNNLFNIVRTNDLVIVSHDYSQGINALKKNVDNIKTVIKRVFFIEDKAMDTTIGFRKNLAQKEAINLGSEPLMIKDSKNKSGFLNKGEIGYVLDGDIVNAGKQEIKIQENPNVELPIKDNFNFFLDLDNEVEPQIKQINEKSLANLGVVKEEPKERKIMFSDVGGMDSTIKELKKNILYPIKHPEIKNGKNMNKSVLLFGPPGTGKSFVAEACANESGAWFKTINASELDSKWVGESEENWCNLFEEARKNQPSVIFIDEIDAIAKKRGGTDEYGAKTLNTILGLMSQSEKRGDQIYMIAATNRKNLLDPAMLRSGRYGVQIEVLAPDLKGTGEILDKYIATENVAKDFDKDGFVAQLHKNRATGSDIASITEEARNCAMEREHMYEKIDDGTYTPKDIENLTIKNEDFNNAFESFKKGKKSDERRPIGFNSSLYQ